MTRILLFLVVAAVLSAGIPLSAQEVRTPPRTTQARDPVPRLQPNMERRLKQLERWLEAVARHRPGVVDLEVEAIGGLTADELSSLWIDVNVLWQLIQNPRRISFSVIAPNRSRSETINYSTAHLDRLRELACVAAGAPAGGYCAINENEGFRLLSQLAASARACGDSGQVPRRAAFLHTDIATLTLLEGEPVPLDPVKPVQGPERVRVEFDDGRTQSRARVAAHWEIARMLLDFVVHGKGGAPQLESDDMVSRWYVATAAWMQHRKEYESAHVQRAAVMFPANADVLFLTGTLHETYASPSVQSAMSPNELARGVKVDVRSDRTELREAEKAFRQALAIRPLFAEAHLRLGRVLFLLGKPGDAVAELRIALNQSDDSLLNYYAQIFLGASAEALRDLEVARGAYTRALSLRPAQSPRLALSALALRTGNRMEAIRVLESTQDPVRSSESADDDPWWTYHSAQGRQADRLLEALRQRVAGEVCQ